MSHAFDTSKAETRGPVIVERVGWRDRLRARWFHLELDRALAAGVSPDTEVALAVRANLLIGRSQREGLARSLHYLVRRSNRRPSITKAPIRRRAVEAAADDLGQLATRLLTPSSVDARGVAQVRLLLTDIKSPIFSSDVAGALQSRIAAAIQALDSV